GSNTYYVPTGGVYNWRGGTQEGVLNAGDITNIATGATLNILGTADKTLSGRTINNNGDVHWSGAGAIVIISGGVFDNLDSSQFFVDNAAGGIANIQGTNANQTGWFS